MLATPGPHDFAPGRAAALARLASIRPGAYARSRNFLDGAVTRLSPYLRHGVLTLPEVREAALTHDDASRLYKFIQELAWREYYVRIRETIGDDVWEDLEPYKTGRRAADYADELPDDIIKAATGLACMDGFVRDLVEGGYVHNHARMWFASYVVHVRGVRWQAGAAFYLAHLLDGDPASNNLSWQWVASTFAHKPYVFNRANLERYSNGAYCVICPKAESGCPFATSYAGLDQRLFPDGKRAIDDFERRDLHANADPQASLFDPPAPADAAIVWRHEESLGPDDPAHAFAPAAPAIFVWDDRARERDPWSSARRAFVEATLADVASLTVDRGDAASAIGTFARERSATTIHTTAPVDPRLREIARDLGRTFDVRLHPAPRLAPLDRTTDLARFSRFWSRAKRTVFGS